MANQSKQYGKVCYYCRKPFGDGQQRTIDHVVPKSRGGYNTKENYVYACFNCNHWKADKNLSVWLAEVEKHLQRGKHRIYTKVQLGQIVGNIKKLLNELKDNKSISSHKVR